MQGWGRGPDVRSVLDAPPPAPQPGQGPRAESVCLAPLDYPQAEMPRRRVEGAQGSPFPGSYARKSCR